MKKITNLLQQILLEFKFPSGENDIIKRILEFIIYNNGGLFDVVSFISYNAVNKSFRLREEHIHSFNDTFNKENAIKDINKCINKKIATTNELPSNMGLVRYVERQYINKMIEDCYIIIPNIEFIEKKLHDYYLNVDYGFKVTSEIIIPVFINYIEPYKNNYNLNSEHFCGILHGILVLDSISILNEIDKADIKFFSNILSLIINANINELADTALIKLINELSKFEQKKININRKIQEQNNQKSLTLSDAEEHLFNAFKKFYFEKDENNNEELNDKKTNNPYHCKLKFASLWIYNNLLEKNELLIRSKSFDLKNNFEEVDIIDNRLIENSKKQHKFYLFMQNLTSQLTKDNEFNNLYQVCKMKDVKNEFYRYEMFCNNHKLSENDIMILLPLLPYFKHIPSNDEIIKIPISLLVMFYDENTYPYYFNSNFLELMSHKIYENFQMAIHRIRRNLRNNIDLHVDNLFSENNFYQNSAKEIEQNLGIEKVLIYLFDEQHDKLILMVNNFLDFPKEINNSKNSFEDKLYSNAYNYLFSKENKISEYIWYDKDYFINKITNEKDGNFIKSMMILPMKIAEGKETKGFIFCINNTTKIIPDQDRKDTIFSKEELEIAEIGSQVIGKITEILNQSNKSKNTLKKLQHELPSLASILIQNIKNLEEDVENYNFNKKHYINVLEEMESEANLINVFSHYAHVENIYDFLNKQSKIDINLINHFKSIFKIFQKDAEIQGVALKLVFSDNSKKINTINVNELFPLAIFNIIRNAIQYSYFGTNILIKILPQNNKIIIKIENIGIPIREEFKLKIMEQGFRTYEARERQTTGTGLGLALSKKIVEYENGNIEIEGKNDFQNRNIFGILCIDRILHSYKDSNERISFLIKNIPEYNNDVINDIKKNLILSKSELDNLDYLKKDIMENYYDFKMSYSEELTMIKKYIERRMNYGENINDIFEKDIDKKISHIIFKLTIPQEN